MTGHGSKLARKKDLAIAALQSQPSIESAARAIGVSSKTLSRWFRQPEFQEAYQKAQRDAASQKMACIQQFLTAALATLLKIMSDPGVPAGPRVRAAACILDHAARAADAVLSKEGASNGEFRLVISTDMGDILKGL